MWILFILINAFVIFLKTPVCFSGVKSKWEFCMALFIRISKRTDSNCTDLYCWMLLCAVFPSLIFTVYGMSDLPCFWELWYTSVPHSKTTRLQSRRQRLDLVVNWLAHWRNCASWRSGSQNVRLEQALLPSLCLDVGSLVKAVNPFLE